jgi:hypothetical protein
MWANRLKAVTREELDELLGSILARTEIDTQTDPPLTDAHWKEVKKALARVNVDAEQTMFGGHSLRHGLNKILHLYLDQALPVVIDKIGKPSGKKFRDAAANRARRMIADIQIVFYAFDNDDFFSPEPPPKRSKQWHETEVQELSYLLGKAANFCTHASEKVALAQRGAKVSDWRFGKPIKEEFLLDFLLLIYFEVSGRSAIGNKNSPAVAFV